MTPRAELVVPALTLRTDEGRPDWGAVRQYAERAATTPVDRFILSGSTTRGDRLSVKDRAQTIDAWLEVVPPDRLLAATWCDEDLGETEARGVAPLPVMVDLDSEADALAFLDALPAPAFVYSHPMLSVVTFDAALAAAARAQGCVPAGGKLAKVAPVDIAAIRAQVGAEFQLWDGSSRNLAASMEAGASGVVATPLSTLPHPFPDVHDLEQLQATLDATQERLDALHDRPQRSALLHAEAAARL